MRRLDVELDGMVKDHTMRPVSIHFKVIGNSAQRICALLSFDHLSCTLWSSSFCFPNQNWYHEIIINASAGACSAPLILRRIVKSLSCARQYTYSLIRAWSTPFLLLPSNAFKFKSFQMVIFNCTTAVMSSPFLFGVLKVPFRLPRLSALPFHM